MVTVISQSVFPFLVLLLYHQQVNLTIFCECMTIFITLAKNLPHLFKKELELFFEKVVFHYLGNISSFHQIDRYLMEKLLLESLLEILSEPLAFERLYRNYDCDVYCLNVVNILFSIVGDWIISSYIDLWEDQVLLLQYTSQSSTASWKDQVTGDYERYINQASL